MSNFKDLEDELNILNIPSISLFQKEKEMYVLACMVEHGDTWDSYFCDFPTIYPNLHQSITALLSIKTVEKIFNFNKLG